MKILKTPFSRGNLGKNPSANLAPDKIMEMADGFYLDENGEQFNLDLDVIRVNQENIDETYDNIIEIVTAEHFDQRVCLLGGDHSITYAGFKAFTQKFPDSGLVILDAHPDCEHGTDTPSHEDFVRKLVEDKLVQKEKLIIIGIRNWSGNEKQFLDDNKIRYFTMKQMMANGIDNALDSITETIANWPSYYLSVDIDVADPSCAPATGHLEPGGLTARQLIYIIQRLALSKNLKMLDLVEVGPDKDLNDITSKLAAKILVELA